jgi:hypothetical protein
MGVVVACFDNLTMNVDYSSYVHEGESGYKLDMTNWFSTPIPRWLACTQFDAKQICENGPSCFEHTCLGLAPQRLACLQYPLSTFPAPHSPQSRRVSSAPTSRSPLSAVYFIPTTRILLPISAHGGSGSCVQLAMGACSTDRMCCRGGGHTRPTSRRCSVGCSHRMTTSNTS